MALFKAYDPGVEVNSETIMAFVDGVGVFKDTAIKILETQGISNMRPGMWYPQQAWLNAFKEVTMKFGKNTLIMIGRSIPKNAKFPSAIDTIEKALASIDIVYHANHSKGNIGNYKYFKVSGREAKIVCDNPYHCDFDQGIITAMCDRFIPADSHGVSIIHSSESGCRLNGSNSCTYMIKW